MYIVTSLKITFDIVVTHHFDATQYIGTISLGRETVGLALEASRATWGNVVFVNGNGNWCDLNAFVNKIKNFGKGNS